MITDQSPETYVVYPNDDIVLKCQATGKPKVTYSWTKDDVRFNPADDHRVKTSQDSGTLIISNTNGNTMRDFQGKYRCYASNIIGTAISHEITVITERMPKWQKENSSLVVVEEGKSLILPCNPPKSAVPARVFWMDKTLMHITQDQRVTTGLDGNLYFSNVLLTDEHPDYICNAHFMDARTILQKEPIALKVLPSNSLNLRQPHMMMPKGLTSTYIALRGKSLELECIAEGYPTPEIEWERLGGSLPEHNLDNFKKTLQIISIEEEDEGEYQCTVKNEEGIVRHVYTVKVQSAPDWIRKPESGLYGPDEHVVLECEASGIPKPNISWKINGKPVNDTNLGKDRKLTGNTMILNSVKTNDTMNVQCEARNKHGTILANAYVYVDLFPPQILTQDNLVYRVVERNTVYMHCTSFGAPVPHILWENALQSPVLGSDRFFQHTNGTLTISQVQKEDTGIYYCTAENEQENVTISAILEVKNATQIISPPLDLRVRKGGKAIFQCEVLFDPTMESQRVEWKKDGRVLEEADDSDKISIEDDALSISNVQEEDQGMYTCVARTDLDVVEQEAELVVIDAPEPPYDLELSNQQDFSVSLTWTPGDENNSPIEEFIIEFEEDSFEPGMWHELTRVPGDQISADLSLSPYVNYQFRVTAVNEIGPGASSPPSDRYKTPKAAPRKNPSDVKGEGTKSNNMRISWKPLKGIYWNGPGFQYLVKWRLQGKEIDWHQKEASGPPFWVEDTDTFVPYEIKVQSMNELGEGPEPKTVIGYSGEDYPIVYPENVGVQVVNRSTILVQWLPVQKEGLNGHLGGYNVYYYPSIHEHRRHHHKTHTEHGNKNNAIITGMAPFTNYSLYVRVFNGKGEGQNSETMTFQTPEGVPSPPGFLRLERQSDTSMVVVWGAPESPNGILTGYVIRHQLLNKTHPGNTHIEEISDPLQQNWTLTNISSKDTYQFYISAKTSAGEGAAAMVQGSTMEEIELPQIQNITYKTEEHSIILSWIHLQGSKNSEIKVELRNNNSGSLRYVGVANASDRFFEMKDLHSGTTYSIQLVALNNTQDVVLWNKAVQTSGIALPTNQGDFATEGWFIGLISAIVLLLLILLILCFIKRSKGGKYSVKDKEDTQVDSEARPMKDETFGEYSDNDEKPFTSSQPSLNGDVKPLGSDDSLADYGGSVDVQFNEDGSFIGQYSGKKEKEATGGNESSGATSPVNPNIIIE
ncbi:neural cell adhesion molecule L1 isoform X2 [Bombina bombina]|nr:neural cell adhesion molecule L1 isoform X2 [Bombina bombina]